MSFERLASYAALANSKSQYVRTEAPVLQWVTYSVTNVGDVAGSDVVLFFVRSPTPGEGGAPIQELAGFERVFLEPGQTINVPFAVTEHDLTLADEHGQRTAVRGKWTVVVGQPAAVVSTITVV